MLTVILIGTDHKFQKPLDGPHRAGIEGFRNTIRKICGQHKLGAVAEEMSLAALRQDNLQASVAKQVCIELKELPHNYSDPAGKERNDLGIRGRNEIILDGYTDEQVNAVIEESNRIREREWLRRIQKLNKWPLLFICGASHFTHFAKLLQETEINVIEACQDWGPIIEVRKPTPLYSDDTYPHCAEPHHCLNEVRRTKIRNLLPDEKIMVKESVYGKDFWALKIEIDGIHKGWVLDIDEGINISYPVL